MKRTYIVTISIIITSILTSCHSPQSSSQNDWAYYLGDQGSHQYSPLKQINSDNLDKLEVAWTYHSGDIHPENRSQIQCNPLVINGILYGSSPSLRYFALDAATGKELWSFSPDSIDQTFASLGVNRGMAFWEKADQQRILCSITDRLYALDAKTGIPDPAFGDDGWVDLHEGLGENVDNRIVLANTPGVVFEDLYIIGTRVDESYGAAPGFVRAFNIISGELSWVFHTIPRPGEYGYETWPEDAWKSTGGANSWSGMSLDKERGIVYIPTGSASFDFYGGDRHGANLYSPIVSLPWMQQQGRENGIIKRSDMTFGTEIYRHLQIY